ncbi:YecA family protein [Brevibacillus sp. SYSU BS000544]|uniref:YecA family protein n=1 Tax=Brevibacillus sp. SYSU BS000544 TaxID=3416443 RepID=UPI003CE47CE9
MSVGRNELCPCGSGKKYKKCCGIVTPITQLQGSREQKQRNEYMQWIERFNRYISSQLTKKEIDRARKLFAESVGLSVEDVRQQVWEVHFLNWFVFDVYHGKTTLIQDFLRQYGKKMDRTMYQGFSELSLGLYQVDEVLDDSVTVHDLATGHQHSLVGGSIHQPQAGQIIVGRLLPLGARDLLFSGSLIVQANLQESLLAWNTRYPSKDQSGSKDELSLRATELYRIILEAGSNKQKSEKIPDELVRQVYEETDLDQLRKTLEQHPSFELKKRDLAEEIWVYAARKEEFLFRALNHTLLELHEVQGEVLLNGNQVMLESFSDRLDEMVQTLHLTSLQSTEVITRLTSTGSRLTRGTIFITSQPTLPKKVLHFAVQTYFAEKWLVTPHVELDGIAPVLAAASNQAELREQVELLVNKMEDEADAGIGAARFMRVNLIRPRLALSNPTVHIQNLVSRPLVHGLTDSSYTVSTERLEDIARFVAEMTDGKSEATVKKYDEAMNLFRSFVRSAFGPDFTWDQLRQEEIAYFLVHDVVERVDTLTKTLASNLLSVLSAFFKWMDKQSKFTVNAGIQPLLADLKEDLPEAYKLRSIFQKEASINLQERALQPQTVEESHMVLLEKQTNGWSVKLGNGDVISIVFHEEIDSGLAEDWMLFGLIGQTDQGEWRLFGTPEVYPPSISTLLGVNQSVLI